MSTESKESREPAQNLPVTAATSAGQPPAATAPPPAGRRRSRRRIWAARIIAVTVDVAQFTLLPLVFAGALSPVNDAIDVVTAIVLTWLIGWHWSFLPAFVAEIAPFVDLVPSWTLAVLIATRHRDDELTRP